MINCERSAHFLQNSFLSLDRSEIFLSCSHFEGGGLNLGLGCKTHLDFSKGQHKTEVKSFLPNNFSLAFTARTILSKNRIDFWQFRSRTFLHLFPKLNFFSFFTCSNTSMNTFYSYNIDCKHFCNVLNNALNVIKPSNPFLSPV